MFRVIGFDIRAMVWGCRIGVSGVSRFFVSLEFRGFWG